MTTTFETLSSGLLVIASPKEEPAAKAPEVGADPVPFLGHWIRGEEKTFSTTFLVKGTPIKLTLSAFPALSYAAVERWLVNSLKTWPHPDAPVFPDEVNYPEYREASYKRLMEEK